MPAFGLRSSGQRIFRPGMFGVLRAEVFADLEVSRLPEAAEVLGDLDGAEVGTQEVEDDGRSTGGEARGVG